MLSNEIIKTKIFYINKLVYVISREKVGQTTNEHGKRSASSAGKKYGPLAGARNKAYDHSSSTNPKLDR